MMTTILGIDYGSKKIGLAIGQDITKSSNPLKIIKNNNDLWSEVDKVFKDWVPEIVVVGKPELSDNKEHPLEKAIEKFIYQLKKRYNVIIYRENEGYSSYEASQLSLGRKANSFIDDYAAAIILESWMGVNC